MFSSDPSRHVSTGVHQELGDCEVRAADLAGHLRQVFLCRESHSQDWSLDCDELCSQNMFGDCDTQTNTWYTVCGQSTPCSQSHLQSQADQAAQKFQKIPKDSKRFQKIPKDAKRIQ